MQDNNKDSLFEFIYSSFLLPPVVAINKKQSLAGGCHMHGRIDLFHIRRKSKVGYGFGISRQSCAAFDGPVLLTCIRMNHIKTTLTDILLYLLLRILTLPLKRKLMPLFLNSYAASTESIDGHMEFTLCLESPL